MRLSILSTLILSWAPLILCFPEHLTTESGVLELTLLRRSDQQSCSIATLRRVQHHKGLKTRDSPFVTHKEIYTLDRQSEQEPEEIIRLYSYSTYAIWNQARQECARLVKDDETGIDSSPTNPETQALFGDLELEAAVPRLPPPPPLTITPLLVSGDSNNRVDLVFFADGYTLAQEEKFLYDAERLALDLAANQTFAPVKPLLNIWAAFTPSEESGLSTTAHPVNTTFGLYRQGTELRGVYCQHKTVARSACASLGTQCDYPILLGNDGMYGGLGGEFSITTASTLNGALVLRHELGHSIIEIGEEYDGGQVYSGVNSAKVDKAPFKWAHWLTKPLNASEDLPRIERSVSPLQAYPWTLLNASEPYNTTFNSSGQYSNFLVRFSLSGAPGKSDLAVLLDGKDLEWSPRQHVGMDRWHYDLQIEHGLSAGQHVLQFKPGDTAHIGQLQLCSFQIIEYGSDKEFDFEEGTIAAYPTFSMWNTTTLRPTNEGCLMRRMVSPNFCRVCLEGLWLALLKRVDLIDTLNISMPACHEITSNGNIKVNLELLKLAQYRAPPTIDGEEYAIVWTLNGNTMDHLTNLTNFVLGWEDAVGNWEVNVHLHTPEVRKDELAYLTDTKTFSLLGGACQTENK